MSQMSISQKMARIQAELAGKPDRDIESLARQTAQNFVGRFADDPDRITRTILQSMRDVAGGLPTGELSTFICAFHNHLELIWGNRNAPDQLTRRSVPHPSQLALAHRTGMPAGHWWLWKGEGR